MSEVKVIKKTASNFEYDKNCDTPYEQIKDNQTCVYCVHMDRHIDHCLSCIFTCTCSDGKVFSNKHADLNADLYCWKKNGRL